LPENGCYKTVDLAQQPSVKWESRKNAPNNSQYGPLHDIQQRIVDMLLGRWNEVRSQCTQPKPEPKQPPLELLEGKASSLLNIVVFGSTCMVYQKATAETFKKRATCGIILGVPV
jgi:hypothetical protein